jgi:hypothetical protein
VQERRHFEVLSLGPTGRLAGNGGTRAVAWQHSPVLRVALVAAMCALAGMAAASRYQVEVVGVAGGLLLLTFICVRPDLYVVVLAGMLLVPYTWSPAFKGAPYPAILLLALPGAGAAVAALTLTGRLRLHALDYLVMAVFLSVLASEVVNDSGIPILSTHTVSHNEAEVILLPYFAFRLILTAWPRVIDKLPGGLMIAGCGLSLMAIIEELAHSNLFAHSGLNNPELAVWEQTFLRAGGVRADAAMGHPIALGSFLLIPLVFAFGKRRWGVFLLLAVGEALTLSRGPYLAVLVSLLLCGILTKRVGRYLVLVSAVAVLALFVGPVRNSVSSSFEGGTSEQKTADYRSELISTSLDKLTFWGNTAGDTSELYAQRGRFTLHDVTSEFALISGRQGVPGLAIWIGFLVAFVYVIREARRRSDELLLLLGVVLVGEWVTLLSVALITSFQYAFWLTVAMTAVRLTGLPRRSGTLAVSHG